MDMKIYIIQPEAYFVYIWDKHSGTGIASLLWWMVYPYDIGYD